LEYNNVFKVSISYLAMSTPNNAMLPLAYLVLNFTSGGEPRDIRHCGNTREILDARCNDSGGLLFGKRDAQVKGIAYSDSPLKADATTRTITWDEYLETGRPGAVVADC
jgi:hypothetical protein